MKTIGKFGYLITIIIPILVFIYFFKGQNLSDDASDWADFATYFSAIIGMANLLVFIALTKEINNYTLEKDKQADLLKAQTDRPILSFIKRSEDMHYNVVNIGNGAALNITIKGNLFFSQWQDAFLYYSIRKDEEIKLYWADNVNHLSAEYEDIFGKKYYSFMKDDYLRFFAAEGEDYPSERTKINYPSKSTPTWP